MSYFVHNVGKDEDHTDCIICHPSWDTGGSMSSEPQTESRPDPRDPSDLAYSVADALLARRQGGRSSHSDVSADLRAKTIRDMAEEAIRLIETGENRAMAADGPVPHFRGELDDIEWRRLWLALSGLRAALAAARSPEAKS